MFGFGARFGITCSLLKMLLRLKVTHWLTVRSSQILLREYEIHWSAICQVVNLRRELAKRLSLKAGDFIKLTRNGQVWCHLRPCLTALPERVHSRHSVANAVGRRLRTAPSPEHGKVRKEVLATRFNITRNGLESTDYHVLPGNIDRECQEQRPSRDSCA